MGISAHNFYQQITIGITINVWFFFFQFFCGTKVHFVGPLIVLILDFVSPSPGVSKPGWFSHLHLYLLACSEPKGHIWCSICLFHQQGCTLCFVVVVSSFQLLNAFSETGYPAFLPMRTKSQGNEVILSIYYHSNLVRTTPLLIKFLLSKFKTKNHLSYNIYYKTHSQFYMRPTINQQFQTCERLTTITTIIALFLSLVMFYVQASIHLHYRTSQNQNQFSQFKTFLNSKCKVNASFNK